MSRGDNRNLRRSYVISSRQKTSRRMTAQETISTMKSPTMPPWGPYHYLHSTRLTTARIATGTRARQEYFIPWQWRHHCLFVDDNWRQPQAIHTPATTGLKPWGLGPLPSPDAKRRERGPTVNAEAVGRLAIGLFALVARAGRKKCLADIPILAPFK